MKRWALPPVDVADLPPKAKTEVGCLQIYSEGVIEYCYRLEEENAHLKDELAISKGEKARPVFKPSRMNEDAGKPAADMPGALEKSSEPTEGQTEGQTDAQPKAGVGDKPKRAGSAKKSKNDSLKIDHDLIIKPSEPIPARSRFKGYRYYTVQDISITQFNTRYCLEHWITPDGRHLTGKLPDAQKGCHFGPNLVSFILYQHHQCHVTQPVLHESLGEWGIDISAGQIDALLQNNKERFHKEKDALLAVGLQLSSYVTVDDTGARHDGKNGYVTHIGNEHFAWFQSSDSKSRTNFLELLRAGHTNYRINDKALAYMKEQGLSGALRDALGSHATIDFATKDEWLSHMAALAIATPRHCRIATEGALMGALSGLPIAENLAIISDDAGQFNILVHGLCWVHAERLVHKMLPLNEQHRLDIAQVRGQIWTFYADLKAYKREPLATRKTDLEKRFDQIFTQKTSYVSLNRLLLRLHKNKSELLLVLVRPEIPLHTNGSEGDIRDYVKKKKISGGTRSASGRKCRDTFTSLKKTCRKLGISFWKYLLDRTSNIGQISFLPDIVEQRIAAS